MYSLPIILGRGAYAVEIAWGVKVEGWGLDSPWSLMYIR